MSPEEIKSRLESLRQATTALGFEAINQKTPMKVDDMQKILKPFINLENAFDREIRKFSTQNKING
jgi:hypothetical protein